MINNNENSFAVISKDLPHYIYASDLKTIEEAQSKLTEIKKTHTDVVIRSETIWA